MVRGLKRSGMRHFLTAHLQMVLTIMIAAIHRSLLLMKHPLVSYPLLPDTPVSQLPFN